MEVYRHFIKTSKRPATSSKFKSLVILIPDEFSLQPKAQPFMLSNIYGDATDSKVCRFFKNTKI